MASDSPEPRAGSENDDMTGSDSLPASIASIASEQTTSLPSLSSPPKPKPPPPANLVPPTSASPSAGTSPHTSRNTSPIRKESRPARSGIPPTQPSAAAIQRALSAAAVPQLGAGPIVDGGSRIPRAPKSVGSASGDTTPQWPLSPRKSPPTSGAASRRNSSNKAQKMEPVKTPVINVEPSSLPSPSLPPPPKTGGDESRKPETQLQAPPKATARGPSGKSTLETVQENTTDSIDPSPAASLATAELKPLSRITDDDKNKREQVEQTQPTESGSESAGNKSDPSHSRRESTNGTLKGKGAVKEGYGTLSSTKSRQNEGKREMTVETETVPSIPQSAINPGDRTMNGRTDNSGSVRTKPSTETIRPKKDRKKASHKARSITQGTASSKADIFEARVANAVDEANSSDSDETFVYESNPPEQQRRRHHSRTPSVTSAHSTADLRIRNFGEMDERRVAGKRSMKFSSNQNDLDSPDSRSGTVRSSYRTRRAPRYDRDGSNVSTLDSESHFNQASKLRTSQLGSRYSRPGSPRSPHFQQQQGRTSGPQGLFSKKAEQSFDFDGEGADDERTPLVGTTRTNRSGRARRLHSSGGTRAMDDFYDVQQRSKCSGPIRGCILGLSVVVGVIIGAILLLVLWNRPLYDVRVRSIKNVLATEQELILDLVVSAINPNALSISVPDMDINVFARSKHVGKDHSELLLTTSDSRSMRGHRRTPAIEAGSLVDCDSVDSCKDLSDHWHPPHISGGVDHGTDPIPDTDAQTMLLGRVFRFDSPLSFENSLWSRHVSYSLGELTLHKPGNKTEEGGSERWEKVLQHPFELIIRGVLAYTLPISTKVQKVAVEASVLVHPEDGVDSFGHQRVEKVNHSDHWQWIDWPDLEDEDDLINRPGEEA